MTHTKFAHALALALGVLTTTSFATMLEIPMSSGRLSGTTVITVNSGSSVTPDTIRIAGATIRLYLASNNMPAVCGAKPTIIAQFLAPASAVWQTPDSSTQWNSLTTLPASGERIVVDSISAWESSQAPAPRMAPGFPLFSMGASNNCTGQEYLLYPHWNRVVFMHYGSGVDYRGKFSFQVAKDTSYSPSMMLHFNALESLTLHYVVAIASNDLRGAPVSLRRPTPSRTVGAKFGSVAELYNPLGVKIRQPGRFEAIVPLRR